MTLSGRIGFAILSASVLFSAVGCGSDRPEPDPELARSSPDVAVPTEPARDSPAPVVPTDDVGNAVPVDSMPAAVSRVVPDDAPSRTQANPEGGDAAGGRIEAGSVATSDDADRPPPTFTRPDSIRGVYLNAWLSGSRSRVDSMIALAARTEINTFVIDVKDATGFVSYRTDVALAREIGADQELRNYDITGLLRRLEEEGIYPVARIVVLKDPILARERPDMAVQDSAGGAWIDGRGDHWVNPYDLRVWEYNIELAQEAVALGFPEIQWDYIRTADRPASELAMARFPGAEGRSLSEAIRGFLLFGRTSLAESGVRLTADVFGVSTAASNDVGIGQHWESMMDAVDALLPMVYPSHYWAGAYGFENPNAHPYEIVYRSIRDAQRRSEGAVDTAEIIPWLQDFTLGRPRYGVPEVRAQILAVKDLGLPHWILWNAAGRYTEGALEPRDGWGPEGEPPIRFGIGIVPAGERFLPDAGAPRPVTGPKDGDDDPSNEH